MRASPKQKVFVAVSGGVDSAVALALLKKQGYGVVGCFMKNWSADLPGLQCNWAGDREDAMRVCAALGVPFRTVDFEKEYRERVFSYFINEYKRGRTPNPDVMCNAEIKFKAFLNWARKNGADMIATGHYARIRTQNAKRKAQNHNAKFKTFRLLAAKDKNKDQSYFLYRLGQKELRHTLFPIGEYTKPEVRAMARKFRLPVADKPDSQGVCFVGEVALREFLKNWIPERAGKIMLLPKIHSDVLENIGTRNASGTSRHPRRSALPRRFGRDPDFLCQKIEASGLSASIRVLGEHPGVQYFTIGQRHGLGLPGGAGEKLYVVAKDVRRNILYVGPKNHPLLSWKALLLADVHWTSGKPPRLPLRCKARTRYRQPLQSCRIEKFKIRNSKFEIRAIFDRPVWAPAPGQSVVCYKNGEVLGGGIITIS